MGHMELSIVCPGHHFKGKLADGRRGQQLITANQQKDFWKLSPECHQISKALGFAGVMVVPGSESKNSIPCVNCTLDAL